MSAALSKELDDGADLVGTFRSFGEIGPVYEVVGLAELGKVKICLVQSGETVDYPVREVRLDPVA